MFKVLIDFCGSKNTRFPDIEQEKREKEVERERENETETYLIEKTSFYWTKRVFY